VYRGRQESVGREVALKVDNRMVRDDRDRRRFLREAHAAGQLSDHPNVISVFDAGITEDGRPYLVMELCSGSLADRLGKDGTIPAPDVREVGVRIADALEVAHQAGVLHRDLKPANILVNRFGSPGLADFGLAASHDTSRQLSATLEALTPAYAAPEVFRMERPTVAVDVYGLAATLYSLLSGRPPRWPADGYPSIATIIGMQNDPIPDLPGVPSALVAVLRKAMANEPADRYPSAAAFRDALKGVALDAPTGMFTAIPADDAIPTKVAPPPATPSVRGSVAMSGLAFAAPAAAHATPAARPAPARTNVMPPVPAPAAHPAPAAKPTKPAKASKKRGAQPSTPKTASPPPPRAKSAAPGKKKRRKWPVLLLLLLAAPFVVPVVADLGITQDLLRAAGMIGNGDSDYSYEPPGDVPVEGGTQAPVNESSPSPPQNRITSTGLGIFQVGVGASALVNQGAAQWGANGACEPASHLVTPDQSLPDTMATVRKGQISYVIVQSANFTTKSGLRVGSSESAVRRIPDLVENSGSGNRKALMALDSDRALLFMVEDGQVRTIVVGRKAALSNIAQEMPEEVC
jgi:hypothetical protein